MTNPHLKTGVDSTPETLCEKRFRLWIPSNKFMLQISGSLIRSKTLMELIFNPCGEFRWSPEDPVSQIVSPHLYVGAPGIFSDLLRSVQMLKRDSGVENNGKLLHLFITIMFFTRLTSWESACKIIAQHGKISSLYPLLPSLALSRSFTRHWGINLKQRYSLFI